MTKQTGITVALSAGGADKELADIGIGMEHVDELMVRVARRLLMEGHRLAFGGSLRVDNDRLTESLIDAALGWNDEESAHAASPTDPTTWPLVNHAAWPVHKNIPLDERAKLVGVCDFIDVDPLGSNDRELADGITAGFGNCKSGLLFARALEEMRNQSALASDLRIVWAGKIRGAKGWMAGILEEVFASLRYNKPVVVIGGFGGCAGLIAEFLTDPNASWPAELSLSASADVLRDALLKEAQRTELTQRFDDGRKLVEEYRTKIHTSDQVNGVSCDLIKAALTESSTRNAIRLATEAAGQRFASLT